MTLIFFFWIEFRITCLCSKNQNHSIKFILKNLLMFEMERWWEKLSNIKDSSHTWSRFVRLSRRTCCRLSFGRAERWTWAELWRTWWSPGRTECRRSEKTLEPDWGSPTVAAHGKNICIFFYLEIHIIFLGFEK